VQETGSTSALRINRCFAGCNFCFGTTQKEYLDQLHGKLIAVFHQLKLRLIPRPALHATARQQL
jgi:hypothetical protein